MRVSIVLPTYNEVGNIVALVDAIMANMPAGADPEILIVDDNSPDDTYRVACEAFKDDVRVVPISRTSDRGLAKSIRMGIERSSGQLLVVMDADFTHDPVLIPRLLHVAQMYDVVSGSRFCQGGDMESKAHYRASLTFNWVLRILLRTQVQDNLGGYFAANRVALDGLPFDLIFQGYGEYYFRLLHFLNQYNRTIVELPAKFQRRATGRSKSPFLKLLFTYSWAAVKLRLASRTASGRRSVGT